tara:strand:+ start:50 stop:652 length:603 start_codon:yes stop_codon:yes gene_type:complete
MKKQLLNESDIRQMMKFANIGALSDGFVERLNETYMEGHDDDHMEEGMHEDEVEEGEHEQDEPEDAMGDEEMDMGDEEGAGEEMDAPVDPEPAMDMDPAGGGDAADAAVAGVEKVFDGLMSTFKKLAELEGPGAEVAQQVLDRVSMSKEEGPDVEEPMADLDMPEPEEEEPLAEMVDEDEIMNEVARRVAKRLLKMKRSR